MKIIFVPLARCYFYEFHIFNLVLLTMCHNLLSTLSLLVIIKVKQLYVIFWSDVKPGGSLKPLFARISCFPLCCCYSHVF